MTRRKAFTFIELIIAVTLFAIIAVSIYSTFNAGLRIWLKTSPMIEENQALRVFYGTITADLKNALYYHETSQALTKPVFGAEYEGKTNFEGSKHKISFMAIVSVSDNELGTHEEPARITYVYDKAGKTVKRLAATKAEGLDENKANAIEMLSGIEDEDFGFEYCYKKPISNTEYEYEWRDAWEDKNVLNIPRGVRVKLGKFRKTVFIPTGVLGEET
ncbi:MAG: prepilin-type N-terminal cleavage/methylation domain-containing protein [Candidatus Omnitrophica bacterium]|nr:prepilin-type N-terminal cleavage/methylation domain-containing protein [Candidatus Omnitrophota bacterium]MDD5436232.1 prepilin-type N-terminal cleavage/methylation domain-containing protein [Candidatus Omnitrophota bacterium]